MSVLRLTEEQVKARKTRLLSHCKPIQATDPLTKPQKAPQRGLKRAGGVSEISLSVPFPPSVNHYWMTAKNGHRYVSARGVAFRYAVLREAKGLKGIEGPCSVEIVAHAPDRRRRDLDNLLKATLDALKHGGLIEDDSLIEFLLIRWGEMINDGLLDVQIAAI